MATIQSTAGVRRALLWKEWREQRWRFVLGAIVLSGLLAGMLRAQIVPPGEAALLIYWPVGVILVIFLAMSPVAAERADRTWEFLLARPVSRGDVLWAKWKVGIAQLLGIMIIATAAGMLAMSSRGFRLTPGDVVWTTRAAAMVHEPATYRATERVALWAMSHPLVWLGLTAFASTLAMACWYTPLMLLLSRARNEMSAALGGVLLTIAAHAWLAQFALGQLESEGFGVFLVSAALNPLAPLVWSIDPRPILERTYGSWPELAGAALIVTAGYVATWIVLPLLIVVRRARTGGRI